MDYNKKISILNRIETGLIYLNINNSIYSASTPTNEQRALSELVYREVLEDSKYNDLMTKNQLSSYLSAKNIWNSKLDTDLEKLNKFLEDLKIQLYESLFNEKKKKTTRRQIKSVRDGINRSLLKKHSLDHVTLENHAETARDEFLVAATIKDSDGNHVYSYDNWSSKDNFILQRFLNFINSNFVSTEEYREIARSEPFRSKWTLFKQNCFPNTSPSPEQITLMMYGRMYDNVYEHPEKPEDNVIEDDDTLDGWFAKQRREAENERKKREMDSILDKGGKGGGEMFVVAGSREEASKIRDVNDFGTRMLMNNRSKVLQKAGKLEQHQLPDVQMELRSEARKQMADRFK